MNKNVVLVLLSLVLMAAAFMVGVNLWGMLLVFAALTSFGYGAGSIMNSPAK